MLYNPISYLGVILFLFGISIGSFLNVLLSRYNPEKDNFFSLKRARGRSYCDNCKKKLKWYELIPVISFIIQLGKCRSCRNKISLVNPFIEILSGLVFTFVPYVVSKFFTYWFLFYGLYLFSFISILWILVILALIAISYIDLRYYIIPNSLNTLLLVVGFVWVFVMSKFMVSGSVYKGSFLHQYSQLFFTFDSAWANAFSGLIFGSVIFLIIYLITRGKAMGVGDIKMIGALGFLFGWPDILIISFLPFIIGTFYAFYLMLKNKKTMKDKIPFGPFIAVSAIVVFFFGSGLLSSYFAIIGM